MNPGQSLTQTPPSPKPLAAQTMVDMTVHDHRTTLLAIRLYHMIYTVLLKLQALGEAVHSVESKQYAWKTRLSMSSSKIA